jgi:molybdopterin/thiamine biosynthesis adenylyltransferase/rhodanese-related sulfurtransferase
VTLSADERARYARQLILPSFGEEGQRRLAAASVLVVGAGGLGSPVLLYLAAAGVGRIGIVEYDRVDASNLHRQVLYGSSSVGAPKLDASRERLHDVNPLVTIEPFASRLTRDNALTIITPFDLVIDGTDNFATRYLINDACVLLGKPNVYGSVHRFEGQVSVFDSARGPCYRCLYPDPPPPNLVPSCAEGGVLGVLPGVIGTLQATEAIKVLAGIGEPLIGRLLLYDALASRFRTLRVAKSTDCPICGERPVITTLADYEELCNPRQSEQTMKKEISATELNERLSRGEDLVLVDVREQNEWDAGHLYKAVHVPLSQFEQQYRAIPRDRDVVVYCKMGGRSAHAQHHLQSLGYDRVTNLSGGVTAWRAEVDPNFRVG